MIKLTENARQAIEKLRRNHPGKNYFRVGVAGGGCSGKSYVLRFETGPEEDDVVYSDGVSVPILIDPKSEVVLEGTELDYVSGGLLGGKFQFKNPNASHTCGCGESFA